MAIQQGIIPLSGKIGDVVFSNRKGKKYAKAKSKKPMKQTTATKKSSSDFGVASKVGARMRRAFAPIINIYGDVTMVSRFTKHILKVFKTIPTNFVGQKKFSQGDVGIFQDFQFNALIKLDHFLNKSPKVKLEASGLKITFQENLIASLFKPVSRSSAVVLKLIVYALNLDGEDDEVISVKDLVISFDNENFRGAKLQVPLNLGGEQVVCVALGMHYLWDDKKSMIGDKTKRAAAIIYVARLSEGVEVTFVSEQPVVNPEKKEEEGLEWELG